VQLFLPKGTSLCVFLHWQLLPSVASALNLYSWKDGTGIVNTPSPRQTMGNDFKTPTPDSSCKTATLANITFLDVQILVAYGQILLSASLCKKYQAAASVSVYERLYRTSYLTVIINASICRISNNFTVSVAITQDPNLATSPLWVLTLLLPSIRIKGMEQQELFYGTPWLWKLWPAGMVLLWLNEKGWVVSFWRPIARSLWNYGGTAPPKDRGLRQSSGKFGSSLCFVDFSIFYISRSCNRVAHTLAKQVSDDNRLAEWQLAPACVDHLMTLDCNPVDPWMEGLSHKKKDHVAEDLPWPWVPNQ
jgi:hypothetical protein